MRKGLSDIVTAVLLILLILVLIGIIWAFIRPTLTDTSEETQNVATCLNVQLEPITCLQGEGRTFVSLERGKDSVAVTSFDIVFTGQNNVERTVSFEDRAYAENMGTSIPSSFEIEHYLFNTPPEVRALDNVKVAARIGSDRYLCNSPSIQIQCTDSESEALCGDINHDGGTDGNDIDPFFTAWNQGDLCADANGDLVVNALDIDAFFVGWEQGLGWCPCTALCNDNC